MSCYINNSVSNRSGDCITNLLRKIDNLQRRAVKKEDESCARDYLGNPGLCFYNTRPVILSNANNIPFEFPINNTMSCGDDVINSCILRIEKVANGCTTCRVLIETTDNEYEGTNSFVTINNSCICSVRCLPDTYLDICF